jgi:hypothetical protein
MGHIVSRLPSSRKGKTAFLPRGGDRPAVNLCP